MGFSQRKRLAAPRNSTQFPVGYGSHTSPSILCAKVAETKVQPGLIRDGILRVDCGAIEDAQRLKFGLRCIDCISYMQLRLGIMRYLRRILPRNSLAKHRRW